MKKEIYNHALDPDAATMGQFESCWKEKYVVRAALMPDAHSGYVAPIGSVLVTEGSVVPAWVGYDIGCGMTAVKLKGLKVAEVKKKEKEVYHQVKRDVPMGLGEISEVGELSDEGKKAFDGLVEKFSAGPHDKKVLQFLRSGKAERHLGSLGHGNHFVELASSNESDLWFVVHSGSRGVGWKAAELYMQKSSGAEARGDYEVTAPLSVDSEEGKEYVNLLEFALGFALENRLEIIRKAVGALGNVLGREVRWEVWVNKNHNHAIKEGGLWVHRKGATPAKRGERGVIPANMRDGSFLVEGKGAKEFLSSSSHGAGRIMSRSKARKQIKMKEFASSMEGITGTVGEETLDEAPQAYKDIGEVMKAQKKSVKALEVLTPVMNWKGTRQRRRG